MNLQIAESSLHRYAKLVQALIPNASGVAILDSDRHCIQHYDMSDAPGSQSTVDRLTELLSDWSISERVQVYDIPAAESSVLIAGVCNAHDDIVAAVAVVVSGKCDGASHAPMLKPLAGCIGQELALNAELDSMTFELTERYEELNLVYHTEDQVNYFREGQEALRNLTQNCLDYLDVGLAALVLKGKNVSTWCHDPNESVAKSQVVMSRLAADLYDWVKENNEIVVINDMSDDHALKLLPGFPYRVLCCPIVDTSGDVAGILATVNHYSKPRFSNSDKNLLQVMARKASKIVDANYDPLTGSINRNGYEHFLESALAQVQQTNVEKCLLHVNVDQLHVINDTVSHAAGDAVIRGVAKIIQSQKREGDTLSRVGGDEFGVILDDCEYSDANEFAGRVCKSIESTAIEFEDHSFSVTVSIGVVKLTPTSDSVAQIMGVAEVACSVAKDQGRNRVETYRPDDLDMVRRGEQMHLVAHIQDSLANDKFVLFGQTIEPLLPSERRHHTEVLMRIIGEDGQIQAPGEFIPAAERYHLMPSIDRWVVEKTLAMLARMDHSFLLGGTFAVNLSGQSLNETSFLDFACEAIKKSGVPPQCLCFEVTETAAVANLARAMSFISDLKKLGCTFSLDDFGAGLSSFGYLKSLPVDYLKIDGGIVKDIVVDRTSAAMVAAINEVGHAMDLKTIAEYVENDEIKSLLQEIGVDFGQGYGIGKPYPFADRLRELAALTAAKAS